MKGRRPPDWSEKEMNALRDGFRNGMSKREIGKWIGRSKSAVAGMLHRIGLKLPQEESLRRQKKAHAVQKAAYAKARRERRAATVTNGTR